MWVSPMHPDPNGAPVSPLGLLGAHPGQGALQLYLPIPPSTHTHSFPCAAKSCGHTPSRVCAPLPRALLRGGPFPHSSRSLDTKRREKTRDLGA